MQQNTSARGAASSEAEQTESTFDKKKAEIAFYKKLQSASANTEPEIIELLRETTIKVDKSGQRSQATSPLKYQTDLAHLMDAEGVTSSNGSQKEVKDEQMISFDEKTIGRDTISGRKEGDAKIKEGLAFLKKFYDERATLYHGQKERNSGGALTGVDIKSTDFGRMSSQPSISRKQPLKEPKAWPNSNSVI